MQSFLIDLLLSAYLSERAKSIDITRLKLPNSAPSQTALLTLETIYLGIQQSLSAHNNNDQTQPQENDEHDEKIIEKENPEASQITITVCDEAKTLKRQFSCNRSLLIREMRYFADYLKDEPDQAEEVDISVHCDLDIFQWLMSFVNRRSATTEPDLEPRIAVSILISSDFLKMDKLVRETLDYIHSHMNEILATNCNVSCIPDPLFRQLSKRFENPYEIELIHDRKNKIRGKIFESNLEQLLTDNKIIRCQYCLTVMTIEQMEDLPCLTDRLILKPNGKFHFQHKIDPKFDINQWTREINTRGESSWRNTFWIVWLHINGDQCARCHSYFRFIDFSTCPYHPLSSVTDGKHDCCANLVSTFDIFQSNIRDTGCQKREHICLSQNYLSEIYENIDKGELVKHHPSFRISRINPNYANEMINKVIEQSIFGAANTEAKKQTMRAQWTPLIDAQPYGSDIKYSWDATKSTRWNQDTQREDEHRRFDEMLRYMQSIQQNNKTPLNRTSKETTSSPFISPGGIYCRIENEWRTRQNSSLTNNNNNNNNATNKNRQRITVK
ncbi:unnamed protein product [Rotaria magnacalcarata]|uniref:SANT and BTB domain-containing protein n=1 Tax=Rotaria magnacalcarata TaxID=392030 RepID=A0A819BYY6_9BILA|nr:unnamed protein product [Rotaria magnacalcarata]CAF2051996.1 unnamed protein product [Rotaria magnacalcarata]CAF3810375.1 unnamed protein product [Rotaria magnacalcarata]